MKNFGELEYGQIPEPLKYSRPFEMTTLSNGIRVCTEAWNSQVASIGVFVGSGSRNETLETSGTAHFLEHLLMKGTSNKTRVQLESEIEKHGIQINTATNREHTLISANCFAKDTAKAVDLLGDMISNSRFDKQAIEVERDIITQELESNVTDYAATLMENVHFNIYREHMMGQPVLGDLDNVKAISQDHLLDFYNRNYFGKNMVIVATGNVRHQDVVDMVEKSFSKIPQTTHLERLSTERPIYIPALQFMRDDEMVNSNVGIFFDAPSWHDQDYYGFLVFQRIMGSWRFDENGTHLNTS